MLTVVSIIDSILDFTFLLFNRSYSSGESCFKNFLEAIKFFGGDSLLINENFFWNPFLNVSMAYGEEVCV